MSGGFKQLQINLRERLISADVNRLQLFKGADIAEFMRYAMDVDGNVDVDAGAVITEHSTLDAPMRATIASGLLVLPAVGSNAINVDPGVLFAISPDADMDSSNYKYVHDAGSTATLTTTANGAGSPRIDVIECQFSDAAVETATRDVFVPSSNTFAPVAVTKARKGSLNYRIRLGTPGAGYPGAANGWLPLAVISAKAGAVTNNDMAFWDVRPLASGRIIQSTSLTRSKPWCKSSIINASVLSAVTGIVEVEHLGYRLGGRLRSGAVVAADADSINLSDANNQDPTVTPTAHKPWYLYLMQPFGLPRWARYTQTGTRLPRSPCGIPVLSQIVPDGDGNPGAAVAFPTSSGLGSSSVGYCIGAGYWDATPAYKGFFGDDKSGFKLHRDNAASASDPITVAQTSFIIGGGIGTARFDIGAGMAGSIIPPHARAILVEVQTAMTTTAAATTDSQTVFLSVWDPVSGTQVTREAIFAYPLEHDFSTTSLTLTARAWVEIPPQYPTVTAFTLRVEATYSGVSAITAGISSAKITGWRF